MKTALILIVVILAVGGILSCTAAGSWDWLNVQLEPSPDELFGSWKGYASLTIDTSTVDDVLFDFPVPVRLNTSRIRYDLINDELSNIAFFDQPYEEGLKSLDYEIAQWNDEGESIVWIRIPIISKEEPVSLFCYVGSEELGAEENSVGVWRNGFVGVYHFDDMSIPCKDSSLFQNHGTIDVEGYTAPGIISGKAGSALDFDGDLNAVVISDSTSLDTMAPFVISAWIKVPDGMPKGTIFSKGQERRYFRVKDRGVELDFEARIEYGPDVPPSNQYTNDVWSQWVAPELFDQWIHVTFCWGGERLRASLKVFVNGTQRDSYNGGPSTASDYPLSDTAMNMIIGNERLLAGPTIGFLGDIDEFRISRVLRSEEWIRFQIDVAEEAVLDFHEFTLLWDEAYLE